MRGRLLAATFFFFVPLFPFLLKTALQASTSPSAVLPTTVKDTSTAKLADKPELLRTELLMGLDLLVRAEHALHDESGAFTSALGRVPDVLGASAHYYSIDVVRATRKRLLITATGSGTRTLGVQDLGIGGDRVSIDQDYRVHANFPVPQPPRDYLHALARVVMNRIFMRHFQIPERRELDRWEGVFRGNFRYEVRPVSNGGRTIVAVGLNKPVAGDIVEMQPGTNLFEWVHEFRRSSRLENEIHARLATIYRAQKIFHEHVGSYSATFSGLVSTWNSLSSLGQVRDPYLVKEFQLDPTLGFHTEITTREENEESYTGDTAWSVNAYGQIAEVTPIEELVGQFERARRKIATHGNPVAEPLEALKVEDGAGEPRPVSEKNKPFEIDLVEPIHQ